MRRTLLAPVTLLLLAVAGLAFLAALGPQPSCYCLGEWDWRGAAGTSWMVAVVEVDGAPRDAIASLDAAAVLGYVNAGYAEEWRGYWERVEGSGLILGPAGYEGEWLVAYWRPEWREVLLGEALRVLAVGVNGVYLDNVDAYEYVEAPENVDPAAEMAGLVCWLAEKVREYREDAIVAVNIGGGYTLLVEPSVLADCIDVVYREELWSRWGERGVEAQEPGETREALQALKAAASRGIAVVVVDPVESEIGALTLCVKAALNGFSAVPQPAWDPDYTAPPPWRTCRVLGKLASLFSP